MDEKMVELVARAIAGLYGPLFDDCDKYRTLRTPLNVSTQEDHIIAARAALSALEAAGYAVVPVHPSDKMLNAFKRTLREPKLCRHAGRVKYREGYKAMIAAAKETGDE